MAVCDVCGNEYTRTFTVTLHDGQTGTFDSFECAVQMMAPACEHCGCRILGHGVETEAGMYCCAHCARESGNPQRTAAHEATTVAVPPPA